MKRWMIVWITFINHPINSRSNNNKTLILIICTICKVLMKNHRITMQNHSSIQNLNLNSVHLKKKIQICKNLSFLQMKKNNNKNFNNNYKVVVKRVRNLRTMTRKMKKIMITRKTKNKLLIQNKIISKVKALIDKLIIILIKKQKKNKIYINRKQRV